MATTNEYTNKSSVLKRESRYIQGGTTELHKRRLGWWERFDNISKNDITDVSVYITPEYANRPDLIAADYYEDALLAWIIINYNNIVDVKNELVAGKTITIPSKQRVYFEMLTKPIRVQASNI